LNLDCLFEGGKHVSTGFNEALHWFGQAAEGATPMLRFN
jgi:hypothetical protein